MSLLSALPNSMTTPGVPRTPIVAVAYGCNLVRRKLAADIIPASTGPRGCQYGGGGRRRTSLPNRGRQARPLERGKNFKPTNRVPFVWGNMEMEASRNASTLEHRLADISPLLHSFTDPSFQMLLQEPPVSSRISAIKLLNTRNI
jgi:hypothetical protein